MAGRVTEILEELRQQKPGAQEEFFDLVYAELRRIAAAQMRSQRPGHTLQPTALVHEAWLRLMGAGAAPWRDRAHFLRTAARAMRSVLVDMARARAASKRGGGQRPLTFDETVHGRRDAALEVVAVHEALERLEATDEQMSRVVELRFFGGLTMEETARLLDIGERTAYLAWEHARAWLFREIGA